MELSVDRVLLVALPVVKVDTKVRSKELPATSLAAVVIVKVNVVSCIHTSLAVTVGGCTV